MQISDSSSRILAGLLEAQTGQQLTMSRRWRIETALSALLRERAISTLDELITILVMGREPGLATEVVEALLNNETYFFRDRTPFDLLARHALPKLAERNARKRRIRIWSAGCSTGQEAYSLAMLFADDPGTWKGWNIEILGTDVSGSVIDRCRSGVYSQFEVQRGLAIGQTIKWFEETEGGWRIVDALRRLVRFEQHHLLEPPPGAEPFDIVLCRNVLLYLSAEKRGLALDRLASGMAAEGWLMLGAGETVIGQTSKLAADPKARGLYRRAEALDRRSGSERRAAVGA